MNSNLSPSTTQDRAQVFKSDQREEIESRINLDSKRDFPSGKEESAQPLVGRIPSEVSSASLLSKLRENPLFERLVLSNVVYLRIKESSKRKKELRVKERRNFLDCFRGQVQDGIY